MSILLIESKLNNKNIARVFQPEALYLHDDRERLFLIVMLKDCRFYLLAGLLFGFLVTEGCSSDTTTQVAAPPAFAEVSLVANTNEYGSANVDTMLRDAWGMAAGSTGGFWIAEKGSSSIELFDTAGHTYGVRYGVTGVLGASGAPTGVVSNSLDSFSVGILGASDFVISTMNGTIAALPHFHASNDSLRVMLDRSGSSSYTGLAIARSSGGARLYAPNIKNQSIDMILPSFAPGPQVPDHQLSQGYTPFNIVVMDSQMYVTHAVKSGSFVQVGAAGAGHGVVDIYDLNGNYIKTLIAAGGKLNSPWGLAVAPSNFGVYSGKLLVGNFGDGTIQVYDKSSGAYQGTLNDVNGKPLVIEGLWSLTVSNGSLYYTAGPDQGANGEFGKIAPR